MTVEVLVVPYDSGQEDRRMGAGPRALRDAAVDALRLGADGPAAVRECHPESAWRGELVTGFELQRVVAAQAGAAYARGHRPVLLSGNCNTMLGVVAAARTDGGPLTVVWFDGHGDANLPEYDAGAFLDGHGLAMLTGHAWQAATATIPGFEPLPGPGVVHAGGRDFNPGELDRLRSWGVGLLTPAQVAAHPWDRSFPGGTRVHLHIDLDVLDPDGVGAANSYAAPDGLSAEQLVAAVDALARHGSLTSVSLASYDPDEDVTGGVRRAAEQVLRTVAPALHR